MLVPQDQKLVLKVEGVVHQKCGSNCSRTMSSRKVHRVVVSVIGISNGAAPNTQKVHVLLCLATFNSLIHTLCCYLFFIRFITYTTCRCQCHISFELSNSKVII